MYSDFDKITSASPWTALGERSTDAEESCVGGHGSCHDVPGAEQDSGPQVPIVVRYECHMGGSVEWAAWIIRLPLAPSPLSAQNEFANAVGLH